jgi:hypothetical protein
MSVLINRTPVSMYYGNTLCTAVGEVIETQGELYTLHV